MYSMANAMAVIRRKNHLCCIKLDAEKDSNCSDMYTVGNVINAFLMQCSVEVLICYYCSAMNVLLM